MEDPKARVVGAKEGKARSTSRYNSEGLGDWLKLSNPNSKVISIAGKDRAACLLGGKCQIFQFIIINQEVLFLLTIMLTKATSLAR